jgi:FkbM family methyltransferase
VFGKGGSYKYTNILLNRSDWRNKFRCIGNNLEKLDGVKENEIIIMAENIYRNKDLYYTIMEEHPNIRVFERDFLLVGQIRNQYLDVFEPQEEEYIIDCGAFNGETEWMFFNWGSSKIKKIYALELDPVNKNTCLNYYENKGLMPIIDFINKGVSNTNCAIRIENSSIGSSGSHIGEGSVMAEVVKLDDLIKGKVTFIKMDIEGAELDALNGAEKIIKTQKPRLAICVYHKPSDIYEIPSYLLSIVPEYKFIVRHYSSYSWETVLYAYVPTRKNK